MKNNTQIKYIVTMALLGIMGVITACNNILAPPETPDTPAQAAVTVAVSGYGGRTVLPNAEIARYRLMGSKTGIDDGEATLADFIEGEKTLPLGAGTWDFTLNAYNGAGDIVMQAVALEKELEPAKTHRIVFNLLPLMDGTGNIHIELHFPAAGITAVEASGDLQPEQAERFTVPAGTGTFTYTKTAVEAGSYIISFTLYQGEKKAAVISESVIVGKGLTSGKVLTLGRSDLKPDILTTVTEGTTLAEKLAWLDSNAQSGGSYSIEVTADERPAPRVLEYAGREGIFITLAGTETNRTISLPAPGSLFTVGKGVTLALDANITLRGANGNSSPLVMVTDGGTFVLNEGTVITGNTITEGNGGGVYVAGGGTFAMYGGEITGNTAYDDGGGVYVADGGTFAMYGGEIAGNTATARYGGGVYAALTGTFTKTGGVITGYSDDTENGNSAYYGDAVYWPRYEIDSTLDMSENVSKQGAAIPLASDILTDGDIPETYGAQLFKFTATAAAQYIHATFGTLSSLRVLMYDSGDNMVASNYPYYTDLSGSTSFTSQTLTVGQEYYIQVWPSSRAICEINRNILHE